MKIVLINKSDSTGGAAVACRRLMNALNGIGEEAKMLVLEKRTGDPSVITTTNSRLKVYLNQFRFIYERLVFLMYEKSKEIRFAFSLANSGGDVSKHTILKQTDIIHIHWFNQGFLSLKKLKKLLSAGKPVVWTLHDMWAFTGGCHYAGDCENFMNECGDCKFIKRPSKHDISNKIFRNKRDIYKNKGITFVTCSKWLADKAKQSSLLQNFTIEPIPNPIDTSIYKPLDKTETRNKLKLPANKNLLLFASANLLDKRKGLQYLIEALKQINQNQPELSKNLELVVFGKTKIELGTLVPFKIHNLSILHDDESIAGAYNAADLFVLPSVEDNLPNTIMESLSCGVPVVAFNTGGIPEMFEHMKSGYLAKFKDIDDLACGIAWYLLKADRHVLSQNARNKVISEYSPEIIARKYLDIYGKLIKNT